MQRKSRFFLSLAALMAAACLQAAPLDAAHDEVPVSRDLRELADLSAQAHLPVLLVFSAKYCDYCTQLDDLILRPMLLSGDYRDKVIIRKLMVDAWETVADFSGARVDARDFADRYRVRVTPTLLFIDANGAELAPRIVGINTPELYGGYVDAAIEQARAALR